MNEQYWLVKHSGALHGTDRESIEAIADMEEGTCDCWERVGVRDKVSFRKYWKMCEIISGQVSEIRFHADTAPMPVSTREDVSDAIKLGAGLFTRLPVISTEFTFCKIDSISYAKMTPAKWAEYIKRVAPFVIDHVLPDVPDPHAQDDLLRMTSKWLREVEREGAEECAA